jgi:hypothetical protein
MSSVGSQLLDWNVESGVRRVCPHLPSHLSALAVAPSGEEADRAKGLHLRRLSEGDPAEDISREASRRKLRGGRI